MHNIRRYIKILNILFLYLLIFFKTVALRIDDINFDKQIDNSNSYKEFSIYNDSGVKIRYKITISSLDENIDLSKILTVYPKIITIEPKLYANFKIFGNSKAKIEKKEYLFKVNLTPIIIPTLQKNNLEKTIRNSSGVILSPSIKMSGYAGDINFSKDINLSCIELKKEKKGVRAKILIENNSYTGLELAMKFYNKNESKLDTVLVGRVNKFERKNIEILLENFNRVEEIETITLYNANLGDIKVLKI